MSAPDGGPDEAAFKMNLPSGAADQMKASGKGSQASRGAGGPSEVRFPNPDEEKQMEASGKASQDARGEHPTGQAANDYAEGGNSGGGDDAGGGDNGGGDGGGE